MGATDVVGFDLDRQPCFEAARTRERTSVEQRRYQKSSAPYLGDVLIDFGHQIDELFVGHTPITDRCVGVQPFAVSKKRILLSSERTCNSSSALHGQIVTPVAALKSSIIVSHSPMSGRRLSHQPWSRRISKSGMLTPCCSTQVK